MKTNLLLFTLAMFVVETGMGQTNPVSTNSQNVAAIANNSGEYLQSYSDSYHDHFSYYTNGAVAASSDEDFTMDWSDAGGGTNTWHYNNDGYRDVFFEDAYTNGFPATPWPEAMPDTGGDPIMFDGGDGSYIVTHNALMGLQSCGAKMDFSYVADGKVWCEETFSENGQARLTLATGGSPGSSKVHLWVVSASATARQMGPSGQLSENPPDGFPFGSIPFTNISAGVFGQLDASGHADKLLPDNTNVDVTPTVAGVDYYTFNDPPGLCNPQITANGVALDSDTVTNGADFCVGEYIKFDVTNLPSSIDNWANWTLPGTFVNTNSDPNCDLYYIDNGSINPPFGTTSTHCWYVLGTNQATVIVTAFYCYYSNGPVRQVTIKGMFNVHRPAVVDQLETPDGTPTPMISSDGNYLTLGANHAQDMSFKHRINPGNFAGAAGYVQLVGFSDSEFDDHVHTSLSTRTPPSIDVSPDKNLDTLPGLGEMPRGPTEIPAFNPLFWDLNPESYWTSPFYDAPSVYLADDAEESYQHLHFQTYLMFEPEESDYGPSIYIPLQKISWKLKDSGQRVGHLYDNTATITSDSDCSAFPNWNGTVNLNANQPEP
jgi:hypothetical protein